MDIPVSVLLDANVLYPAPLRDLLIRLAQNGLIRPKWSNAIHDEWMRNLVNNNPSLNPDRLIRTKNLMNDAVRDCLVQGFEPLINSLTLPDPDDRHVLAAAIHARVQFIVTFNLKDFPAQTLATFHMEAIHPDELLIQLFDSAPGFVCSAIKRQRESLRNPPRSAAELVQTLNSQGLPQFVDRIKAVLESL
ncbi:MAG: PIN domain-containing protein [bacterium]